VQAFQPEANKGRMHPARPNRAEPAIPRCQATITSLAAVGAKSHENQPGCRHL